MEISESHANAQENKTKKKTKAKTKPKIKIKQKIKKSVSWNCAQCFKIARVEPGNCFEFITLFIEFQYCASNRMI